MKANEAPEKIYLLSTSYKILDGWYDNELPIPKDMKQFEYTRTDAFIDKACDWFRRIDYTEEFIEDFRKYMKGE